MVRDAMKQKTICVIGAFAYGSNAFGGQISKTRNYSAELHTHFHGHRICEISTSCTSLFGKMSNFVSLVCTCLKSDVVIILPGQNGIKVILPIVTFIKKFRKILLLYPVVGGWLPVFVKKQKRVAVCLRTVDRMYVETNAMLKALNDLDYFNVERAPVFSRRQIPDDLKWYGIKEPVRLCTFSRVIPEKGIPLAIEAVNYLNRQEKKARYELNIYGAIAPEYSDAFKELVKGSPYDAVHYKGTINDQEVITTLAENSALLFPTSYPGEGFPATVLEGMMAGLPVIASDWRYNNEIITPGYNGYLFNLEDGYQGLAERIKQFSQNEQEAWALHNNCVSKAKDYAPQKVLEPMFHLIEQSFERN